MAKPSVGIVFSCEGAFSKHSEYFSIYFGTCLSKEGYSKIKLIPLKESDSDENEQDFELLPCKIQNQLFKPNQVFHFKMGENLEFSTLDDLKNCHVVIVAIERGKDVKQVVQHLKNSFQDQSRVPLFVMFHSVRVLSDLRDELEEEAVSCFHIVGCLHSILPSLTNSEEPHLQLIYPNGGMVFERLSKKLIDSCNGPLNLLLHTPFQASFDRTLSQYSWGALLLDIGHYFHFISSSPTTSYSSSLSNHNIRLLFSEVMFESYYLLVSYNNSRSSKYKWHPSTLSHSYLLLYPIFFIFILQAPTPIFKLLSYFLWRIDSSLSSPISHDIYNHNLPSLIDGEIGEILKLGKDKGVETPYLSLLYSLVKAKISSQEQEEEEEEKKGDDKKEEEIIIHPTTLYNQFTTASPLTSSIFVMRWVLGILLSLISIVSLYLFLQ